MFRNKFAIILLSALGLISLTAAGCATGVIAANKTATASVTGQPQETLIVVQIPSSQPPTTSTSAVQTPDASSPARPPAPQADPVVADFTLDQLYADYQADPAAAAARYGGKTFIFKNVYIDDITPLYKPPEPVGYVYSGRVMFRADYKVLLLPLKPCDIVDIQGTVIGVLADRVLVDHCTYTVVDDTNGVTLPNWITIFA